ncbi:KAP family P-loop domain-containing protein [Loktanella salsilacus]|uniref:KAP family P-loop domain-containing protein n=1 Tax=Loktanella salsilacus TaxID=195913 RepID=A0A1I4IYV7_9RHOB|nr:P-loop NTPase fold protein [Loktanella salsilacus]SFL59051.1 KAP family P-loop domain-containing protein [Loktanella salsilacus]
MYDAARNQIRQYLSSWVNSPDNPKFAVMIEGRWGCGKTHFIQSLVSQPDFTKRKTIYLSLFGVSSLQDFERQLFYAASSKAIKIMHQGVGFASSLFSGAISVGSGGVFSGSADIGKAVESTLGQVTKAADAINEALVIIDDLERCGFDQSELLGVLNRYIEHGNSRVILVANTQRIDDKKFEEFREKVIGQTFEIPPDPKAAVAAFIAEISESVARTLIVARTDRIEELYLLSGFNNLRAIRQFLWFLIGMLEATDQKFRENNGLIDSLITQAFIFFMEFRLNLGGPENSLAILDLLPEYGDDDPAQRSFYAFRIEKDDPDTPKRKVILKYNLINGIETAITLRQWIDILNSGTVDAKRFNAELAGAPEVNGPDSWPSWKRLWHIWSWDFSDGSATEFDSDIGDICDGIEEGRYENPLVVMYVVGVILMLLDEGLIEDVESGWVQRFKRYIDEIVIPSLDLDSFGATRWSFDSGYEGLGYAHRENDDFVEVLSHLQQAARDWYSDWKAEPVAKHLIETLKSDYFAFLGDLKIVNGKGTQRFLREPILQTIDEDDFVNAWLSLGRQEERLLTGYFEDRYDQVPELILTEGPWWHSIANRLLIKIDDEPIMPRKSQLLDLIKGIERLVDDRLEKARLKSLFSEPTCQTEIDLGWTLAPSTTAT